MNYHQPIYLSGPTACGKTGVSVALAKRLEPAVIINADAFQVYRGIETLAATPSEAERGGIDHFLFGVVEIDESCDAATFSRLARGEIHRRAGEAVPIVVGGSGLYLKSITHGLAPTPPADPEIRRTLDARTLDELVEEYRSLDPEGAAATNLKNRRYVTRNLEICLITGEPASRIKAGWATDAPDIRAVYLERDREDVYGRINRRTESMFENGVVEEIAALERVPSATAAKAIGLAGIQSLLRGEITREEAIARIQQMTRRFAKRQETWFKREPGFRRVRCEPGDSAETIADRILEIFPPEILRTTTGSPPFPGFSGGPGE